MKIALVSVFVSDPMKAIDFYTGTLGFVEKMKVPEAHLAIVASAQDPDGTALLLEPNQNPIASTYQKALYDTGIPCIVFGVDDVASEYKRLQTAGVVFRGEPETNEYGTQATFEDTFGNLIRIHQV